MAESAKTVTVRLLRGVQIYGTRIFTKTKVGNKEVDSVVTLPEKVARPLIKAGKAKITTAKPNVTVKKKTAADAALDAALGSESESEG